MIHVEIVVSGSGNIVPWRTVSSLEEATKAVQELDKTWLEWCEGKIQIIPPAVQGYEGCDVYARTDEGPQWFFNEDEEWELVDPPLS